MEQLLFFVNGIAYLLIALALLGAILSPRVRDGVLLKIGMGSMALGFMSLSYHLIDGIDDSEIRAVERALLLLTSGMTVALISALWRRAKPKGETQ